MKLIVVSDSITSDDLQSIQSIPNVIVVQSPLYSLQVDDLQEHINAVKEVVIVDMALRYENVVEFLSAHNMPIMELHANSSGSRSPEIEYDKLTVERHPSFDSVVKFLLRSSTEIVNLTPHDVTIIKDGEVFRAYAPSGKVAKLTEWDASILVGKDYDKMECDKYGNITLDGCKVVNKLYGDVVLMDRVDFLSKADNPKIEKMPEEKPGVVYIVPMLVGQKLAGTRKDLYGPDFGIGGVRTADGKISGAVGFIKY